MGSPVVSCPALARPAPPPPSEPLVMRRALVGGHTDADTRWHTPHEKTSRWCVLPPSQVAHAEETGPAPGSTGPHGRDVPQAPSHTPAAPWWYQTGRCSTAVPQRGVRWLHTGEAEYSNRWSGVAMVSPCFVPLACWGTHSPGGACHGIGASARRSRADGGHNRASVQGHRHVLMASPSACVRR